MSQQGRIFVNFPRWSDNVIFSVKELVEGQLVPYPDVKWNHWKPGLDIREKFVCVQSVFIDKLDRLWVLDSGNPWFDNVIDEAPKLVQVDLQTNQVVKVYRFEADVVLPNSYLNDVRIDIKNDFAFITDSGAGALISLNLKTEEARRLLDYHPSTSAENITLIIGKKPWMPDGNRPRVHSDGIAYDAVYDMVYYQALTAKTMYRIPGAALRDFDQVEESIEEMVDEVGHSGVADGLFFGSDQKVYISALEEDAILRTSRNGKLEIVVKDERISWPDSFSEGPVGFLYFTTARIHEGQRPKAPYRFVSSANESTQSSGKTSFNPISSKSSNFCQIELFSACVPRGVFSRHR